MTWYAAIALMMGGLMVFLAIGMPVAFAFLSINLIGAVLFLRGEAGLGQLVHEFANEVTKVELAPIPLFLLMGELMYRTRLAEHAIDAVDRMISRVPGRLSVVAVTGGTIFSALSGSTIATTAMLGKTMLPNMLQRGYKPEMAMGPIMAIGGVDMLIPPSALTVLLATLASGLGSVQMEVSKLLIAGIVPGLIMSVMFLVYIVGRCALDPSLAPRDTTVSRRWGERLLPFVKYVMPLFLIVVVVIGSMFAGIASPTESAALGCVATAIVALCYRSLTWTAVRVSLVETAQVTVMILFIIGASIFFARIISLSGASTGALGAIGTLGLGRFEIILYMVVILLILGCFLDQVSMMLLTLPFFMPLVGDLKIDPIWFGTLFLISMQIGLLTPPFGLLLFVMKGVSPPDTRMQTIYGAAAPFIVLMFVTLCLVLFVPEVAVWLPGLTGK